jgi:hypothetical protein
MHSLEQRVAETVDREQTLEIAVLLQTLGDVVSKVLNSSGECARSQGASATLIRAACENGISNSQYSSASSPAPRN